MLLITAVRKAWIHSSSSCVHLLISLSISWVTSSNISGSKNHPTFVACASKIELTWSTWRPFWFPVCSICPWLKKEKKVNEMMALFRHLWSLGILWNLQHWAGYDDFQLLSSEAAEAVFTDTSISYLFLCLKPVFWWQHQYLISTILHSSCLMRCPKFSEFLQLEYLNCKRNYWNYWALALSTFEASLLLDNYMY